MDNHVITRDYFAQSDVDGYDYQIGTLGYPLAMRVHAFNPNDPASIDFCAEIPVVDGINTDIVRNKLKLDQGIDLGDRFTFSVQALDSALQHVEKSEKYVKKHMTQEIALKPQWNFYKIPDGGHLISSDVTCQTIVFQGQGEAEFYKNHEVQNVCIHGSSEYNTDILNDTHHLGFTGADAKSRAILYHASFSNGSGSKEVEALNGQSKTGLILLYNNRDMLSWLRQPILWDSFLKAVTEAPMVRDSEFLLSIFGIVK